MSKSSSQFKFKLPKKMYGKNLATIKGEVETLQPICEQDDEKWRKPILTNYGCACFHFSDEGEDLNLIQVVLSTIPLEVDYTHPYPNETAENLRRNADLMDCLSDLKCGWESDVEHDVSLEYESLTFEDDDDERRLTIYVNDVEFEPDETLEDLEAKIDSFIEPLKSYIVMKPRANLLLRP
jgi:hypothetical protein